MSTCCLTATVAPAAPSPITTASLLPSAPYAVDYRGLASPGLSPMPPWLRLGAQEILRRHQPWSTHAWIELRKCAKKLGNDLRDGDALLYLVDHRRDPLAMARLPRTTIQVDLTDPTTIGEASLLALPRALNPLLLRELPGVTPYCDRARGQAALDLAAAMARPLILDRVFVGTDCKSHRESLMLHRDPGPGRPWRITDLWDGVPIGHHLPTVKQPGMPSISVPQAIGNRLRAGFTTWLAPGDLANCSHRT